MLKKLLIVSKLAISGGILYAIGRRFDIVELVSTIKVIEPIYLLIAIIFAVLAVPAIGNRWKFLAEMLSVNISFFVATQATFAGLFVGQVLPGAIGADVVRGWMIWNMGTSNKRVIASLIMDRFVSLFAVVFMVVIAVPILMTFLPKEMIVWAEWFLIGVFMSLTAGFLALRFLKLFTANEALGRLMSRLSLNKINISIPLIAKSLVFGVTGHGLVILSAFFLSLAIGVQSSFWMWWLIMPIIILTSAVPISINGWGIRELVMISLWPLFGMSESDAFLISICLGIVAIISSLPGAWFWITRKAHRSNILIQENDIKKPVKASV
ncbi:lysylphosphatidylglycerol synthase transmembrane domain-containing protein [Sulfuriflexus mobilis]|uniref:lysylphosphatidylglycerol synthase transmembrane domain-containing protein n=1 Tax=Sulfuriflexus mobilis TaxID=1811807 RepID=UPI00155925CD|nr:lysylphosphatidylglycerol synthase transmembrane domain-containing protein [Sulfuriflexus mobilis]